MKNETNYLKIKWSSFFLTFFILGVGVAATIFFLPPKEEPMQKEAPSQSIQENTTGYYENETFAMLLQENLSDLGFIDDIAFEGSDEGHFTISGTLSDPTRLATLCTELTPFSAIMETLKNKRISIHGHLGENANGYGQFVTDTISFSGHTIPAGVATKYIEEYTGLNDLLEVPINEIELDQYGIRFHDEIPAAIQIASYNLQHSSLSGAGEPAK